MRLLSKRPWLLVVVAFVLLVAAWAKLFFYAQEHADRPLPAPEASPP